MKAMAILPQMRRWFLAKQAGKSPRDLASLFAAELAKIDGVISVDIAGPGFLNLTIESRLWTREIADILAANLTYGKSDMGQASR